VPTDEITGSAVITENARAAGGNDVTTSSTFGVAEWHDADDNRTHKTLIVENGIPYQQDNDSITAGDDFLETTEPNEKWSVSGVNPPLLLYGDNYERTQTKPEITRHDDGRTTASFSQINVTSSIIANYSSVSSSPVNSTADNPGNATDRRSVADGGRRSRDSYEQTIDVNQTSASTDRLLSVGLAADRTESAANQFDLVNSRNGYGSPIIGFYSPEAVKIAALCGTACLVLLLIPMMSLAICRRQRRRLRRGSAAGGDAGGKRKLSAGKSLQRVMTSSGVDYSRACDATADASLPLKRPGDCYSCGTECNCHLQAPPLSSFPDEPINAVAAARCRAKRYRTRVRDDVELERLQQPDDWGTPPPSYRQLIPGSPSSLSSAAFASGGGAASGSGGGPVRRYRRPLFFGTDLSSSSKIYDLVPEPPPPPLPPRAGISGGFRVSRGGGGAAAAAAQYQTGNAANRKPAANEPWTSSTDT
jgi:hypothetical protein